MTKSFTNKHQHTEEEILAFEIKHSVLLPPEHKAFLISDDGKYQEIAWNFDLSLPTGNTLECEFAGFHSLKYIDETWDSFVDLAESWEFDEDRFPDRRSVQSIGTANGSPTKLCMGFKNQYYGKIYLFEHNMWDDFILVANNLNEFLKILKPVEYETNLE